MTERTGVEKNVRLMIASDILYRPLKSLGEKGVRRIEKTAKSISALLKNGSETGERIFAKVEIKSEEEKARTINEGIIEFCSKYPKEGKILNDLIEEKRSQRNKYLTYGLMPNFKLGEEDYVGVMKDLGFERREASSFYPHIISYSKSLGKAYEQSERTILLK